jgi:hypothetical protein
MKILAIALTVALVIVPLASCSKGEDASSQVSFSSAAPPAAPPAAAPAATPAAQPSATGAAIARSATGTEVVSIGASRIEIVSGGSTTTLAIEAKETGKRKYYDGRGSQLAEVKASDTGFKVRTPGGALLWKVRLYDDKIKVSDNEENLSAWVLKTGYPDKAKILDPSEAEIGDVRFASAPDPIRVRTTSGSDAWTVEGGRASAAWGVLMMERVPAAHRAIIVTELLARGR